MKSPVVDFALRFSVGVRLGIFDSTSYVPVDQNFNYTENSQESIEPKLVAGVNSAWYCQIDNL